MNANGAAGRLVLEVRMTLKLGTNLIETDDSVPARPGPTEDTVIVRIKSGENWQGNTFENCDLQIPRRLLVDVTGELRQ